MKRSAPAYDDSAPPSFRGPVPKQLYIGIRDRSYSQSCSTSPAKATTAEQLSDHFTQHVRMPHERPKSPQKREFPLVQEKRQRTIRHSSPVDQEVLGRNSSEPVRCMKKIGTLENIA
ncbi:hypothetical protein Y032_0003g1680 [Ancylostoma ceylanicum]|uniref:Uncharacterized protein n=1 Tax=Ancylostoma ceylanicum TaxID=53326 RepID=A0A016W025_9BILA|nr:hypothetical protein Y032_0003g1680 [Ancylostoma ceylanicum]